MLYIDEAAKPSLGSKKFKSLEGGMSKIKFVNFRSPYSRKVILCALSLGDAFLFQRSSLADLF